MLKWITHHDPYLHRNIQSFCIRYDKSHLTREEIATTVKRLRDQEDRVSEEWSFLLFVAELPIM